jgi:hypothetical protein
MFKKEIRGMIWCLVFMSLGGFILHFRAHPPKAGTFNWIPTGITLFNVLVLPFLFNRRNTAPLAYMINWITILIGSVAMAYYSVATWKSPLTIYHVIFHSTLADIVILFARAAPAEYIHRWWYPAQTKAKGEEK